MATAMQDPSSLLAEVAARIHGWEVAGAIPDAWMDWVEPALADAAGRRLTTGMSNDFLVAKARRVLNRRDPGTPSREDFLEAAEALQALDGWHAPLDRAAGAVTKLDDMQEAAVERLVVEGRGYNPAGPFGTVIPADAGADSVRGGKTGIVAQLLHATVYLPPFVAAGDPNDASAPSDRQVELRYVARHFRSGDPRGPIGEHPRIAVAPVLQELEDAAMVLRTNPDRYGVRLHYDHSRLEAIVAAAVAGAAHLLFLPEMVVDAAKVDVLASAVRRCAAAHRGTAGHLPQLRFVVAGLTHDADETGNNSIVVLDIEGRKVFEQDKLCRWNLKWYHQRNYGVRPDCASDAADLDEDIPGGTQIWIADLQHLGRFLTLICADMDYDKPGDWLIRNVAVDWLHAPVMDKSIAWGFDGAGEIQPWIVRRAKRAGEIGVPKVIVTNSMLLTLLLNVHNVRFPDPNHPPLDRCAFAFLVDSEDGASKFRQLETALPCPAAFVEVVQWLDGFASLPTSAAPHP